MEPRLQHPTHWHSMLKCLLTFVCYIQGRPYRVANSVCARLLVHAWGITLCACACVCVCLSCVSAANAPGYVSSDLFLFMYFPFLNSRPREHAGGYTDTEEWEAHFIYFLSRVITQHKYPCRQKDGEVRTPKAWEMEVFDSSSGRNIIANSLYWLWCKDIKFLG